MKKVEAIIRPHLLDAVKNALQEVNVLGMTVSEVQGYGRQRGHTETYRGAEYQIEFVPKIKLEVIIPDDIEDFVIHAITKTRTAPARCGCTAWPASSSGAGPHTGSGRRPAPPAGRRTRAT